MKTFTDRIIDFNINRNIARSFDKWTEYENIKEELTELIEAKNDSDDIDALCDIIVFSIGAIWKKGYSVEEAMNQTLKEIESRRQDIVQASIWAENGSNGEKWQKDKRQCTDTLYKANYDLAKEA